MTLMSLTRTLTPRDLARWTARLYLQHWPRWMALALIALIPLLAVNQVFEAVLPQPAFDETLLQQFMAPLERGGPFDIDPVLQEQVMAMLLNNSLLLITQMVLMLLSQVIIVGVVAGGAGAIMASAAFHGRPVSLREGLRGVAGRAGPLLGGNLAAGLLLSALLVGSLMLMLLCVGVIGLSLAVYVYLALVPLLPAALVLERGTTGQGMRGAWHAGKINIWVLLFTVASLFAARAILSMLLSLLLSALAGFTGASAGLLTAASLLGGLIVEALVMPIGVIFFTLLYVNTRPAAPALSDPGLAGLEPEGAPAAARPANPPLFTAADLPNVIGVSLTALGMLLVLYMIFTAQLFR